MSKRFIKLSVSLTTALLLMAGCGAHARSSDQGSASGQVLASPAAPSSTNTTNATLDADLNSRTQAIVATPHKSPDEAGFTSPFASSVEGLTIPNSHYVGRREGSVIRGMNPLGKASELKAIGITDILIFKNETRHEVSREVAELQAVGYTPDRIYTNIPFRWKTLPSFQEACEQAVDALVLLENAYRTPGRSIYFHCTLGEDRTGLLAALFRMIETPTEWDTRKAFDEEMCANGYEAGDPTKEIETVQTIRGELTPLFLKLATLIESGALSAGHLDRTVCSKPIESRYEIKDFTCKASPLYSPRTP